MNELTLTLAAAAVAGIVSGLVSAMLTVSAIKVHVNYLRKSVDGHEARLRTLELRRVKA